MLLGPKFLTQFYKFGSPSNTCQNLVTIDRATSIKEKKERKKEINDSIKSDWPVRQHS